MSLSVQNHNHYTTAKAIIYYILWCRRGKSRVCLLIMVIKPETVLYKASTISLLESFGRLVHGYIEHVNGTVGQ